jgi:hypothetical protein
VCGVWRLESGPATVAIVDAASSRRVPVALSEDFIRDADLTGEITARSAETLRQQLAIVGVTRYRLTTGTATVFNLATGDHHISYGRDDRLPRATPKRVEPRRCARVPCPVVHPTMHHGSHLDVAAFVPRQR